MKVSIQDIQKLRKMTGAGLTDCKKALVESEGNMDKAIELVRERGLAIAAKRSDRATSNGCILVKKVPGFAAMVGVKCETDFVAAGKDFIAMVQEILDGAIANHCKSLDEVKQLKLSNGDTAELAVKHRSGITGEHMDLDGYNFIEGDHVSVYDHMNKHLLATMVQLNEENEEAGHKLAMQVAAMNPVALDEAHVSQETKTKELEIAVQKTKEEQVQKAVTNALKKAGYNLYIAESEEHLNEGILKKEITEADADEIRKIKKEVAEQKAAHLPEQMIQNIAKGRMNKFYKENCLVDQEFQFADGDKVSVSDWLKKQGEGLKIVDFRRFTLLAE